MKRDWDDNVEQVGNDLWVDVRNRVLDRFLKVDEVERSMLVLA
jgi:hypothetical protein